MTDRVQVRMSKHELSMHQVNYTVSELVHVVDGEFLMQVDLVRWLNCHVDVLICFESGVGSRLPRVDRPGGPRRSGACGAPAIGTRKAQPGDLTSANTTVGPIPCIFREPAGSDVAQRELTTGHHFPAQHHTALHGRGAGPDMRPPLLR